MITTPTPRTDAATFKARRIFDEVSCVYSDFSRQLESELAQKDAEAARLREALATALRQWEGYADETRRHDRDDALEFATDAEAKLFQYAKTALSTTAGAEMLKERDAAMARVKELEGELDECRNQH